MERKTTKITYVTTWRAQCGLSTYSSYLINEIVKRGHEVKVLAEQREISGRDDTQKIDVPYIECWNRYERFDGILPEVQTFDPDVIHVQHEFGLFGLTPQTTNQFIGSIKKITVPIIITYHSVPLIPNWFFQSYFKETDNIFKKKIFHSQAALNYAINTYKTTDAAHINHGVKLCPLLNKDLGFKFCFPTLNSEDRPILMSMGYFGGLKGVMELIEVFYKFKQEREKSKFIYVGGLHPPTAKYGRKYMVDCMRKIIDLGLKDDFIITGYVPEGDLPYYYAAADLFILNYYSSGYISASGCAAKLMAARRPIITTSETFRNEELINGKTCLKVPAGDDDALLVAIKKILNNKELYRNIVDGAYEYALENRWENIAGQHIKLYEEATS